ncbi:MAG: ribonuclease P protein subunit [archaeon]|jgi:ribonuclease P protein subunit POP4
MIHGKEYEINEKNIKNHEMIGLNVKVIESSDPKKTNMTGKIIDETKNTFILDNKKIIPKKECVFEFTEIKAVVNGKDIIKKPEDRIR